MESHNTPKFPPVTERQRAEMRALKDTHTFTRVISPGASTILKFAKDSKAEMYGLPVNMLHGAVICIGGLKLTDYDVEPKKRKAE